MSIRIKTILVIAFTIIPLFFIVYFIASNNILQDFAAVENRDTQQQVSRANDAMQGHIANLLGQLGGWAVWDDSYKFMIDHNPAFVKTNLHYEVIKALGINMLIYIGNDDKIVAKLLMDYSTGRQLPLPPSLLPYFQKGSRVVTHTKIADSLGGIIIVDKKPLLITAEPILTSKGEGPIHGTLIFARYIDPQFEKDLSSETHLHISIYPYDSQLPIDVAQAKAAITKKSPTYIKPLSRNQIAGYSIIPDIAGKPAVIIKVATPRSIYQEGQKSIATFTILFAVIAVIFAITMLILLERTVLSRILALYKQVLAISQNKDKKARISLSGNDEISKLGTEINNTLDSLNQAISAQQESEEAFRNTADIAPAMIWMANTEGKCTYFNKPWLEFTGRSEAQELGEGWQENIHPEDKDVYILEYRTAIGNKTSYKKEVRFKRADGQYRWILTQIIPNTTPDGIFIGCLGAGADITDVKEASEKVEQANKEFLNRELTMSELKKENERLAKENEALEKAKK
jgi:PAS domain S-box-containing protein